MSRQVAAEAVLDQRLRSGAAALGLNVTEDQAARLLRYLGLLEKWNKVYNLTAIRDPRDMLTQHLLDSLAVLSPLRRQTEGRSIRVLDVGSGGGLPGVVISICRPDIEVVCVDAVAKKVTFVRQVAAELGLANLRAEHSRVEEMKPANAHVVVSRAFSSLRDMVTWTVDHLAADGVWMAMKGKLPEDEMVALPPSVSVFHVEHLKVPELEAERCIVWIRPSSSPTLS
ncbi:16S rRNA (guanine(527)-N(7))-methyltransferase RsmG [Aquabacterium sp. A7-Y]|uniref:16S rRNA (guanine(527)-N(7))-methyltransferase RsmG n=1 Tax=Aquabacterium sp. A7-Y TaxID=1349605 RepID=UPI00223D7528|nr:16S rRNA (guanine(527)-N(7))-methyltransferase RsmG [Aquabacterium sp. A7-Y]MCW7538376.1 16S rRNA (guanine(527)-N(7))-methyltransferase RsmG [Aquabacterium sp. A7-Y]